MMILGWLLIAGISVYYLLSSKKLEAYFLALASILLLLLSIFNTFILPFRITGNPEFNWTRTTVFLYVAEAVLWVVFGIGFVMLILRAIRLHREQKR